MESLIKHIKDLLIPKVKSVFYLPFRVKVVILCLHPTKFHQNCKHKLSLQSTIILIIKIRFSPLKVIFYQNLSKIDSLILLPIFVVFFKNFFWKFFVINVHLLSKILIFDLSIFPLNFLQNNKNIKNKNFEDINFFEGHSVENLSLHLGFCFLIH